MANLADLGGTLVGILVARSKLPTVPAFMLLSAGYLIASRKEIDSIQLSDINRARLAVVARCFAATGKVGSTC